MILNTVGVWLAFVIAGDVADSHLNREPMPHRVFVDSLGRTWEVWPVPAQSGGGSSKRLTSSWLVFETRGEKRRLSGFPVTWTSMTDAELEQLCREAREAPVSRRLIE